jgi:hypothetical protein
MEVYLKGVKDTLDQLNDMSVYILDHLVILRTGSDYAQVERRSVTFLDQTMSRGEAVGLKNYIKDNPLSHFEYFNEKEFGLSTEVWVEPFCLTQTLLERLTSWRHNFLKVLPPTLFWRRRLLDFGL